MQKSGVIITENLIRFVSGYASTKLKSYLSFIDSHKGTKVAFPFINNKEHVCFCHHPLVLS